LSAPVWLRNWSLHLTSSGRLLLASGRDEEGAAAAFWTRRMRIFALQKQSYLFCIMSIEKCSGGDTDTFICYLLFCDMIRATLSRKPAVCSMGAALGIKLQSMEATLHYNFQSINYLLIRVYYLQTIRYLL
jgi:hypothetical protein